MATGKKILSNPNLLDDYSDFNPEDYLKDYYSSIGSENTELLRFFAKEFREVLPESRLLDFGCGPTIYQVISAADKVAEIHLSDYLQRNLDVIKSWIAGAPEAFDWTNYIRMALTLEGLENITTEDILEREEKIKDRITKFFQCNFSYIPPISGLEGIYDVLMSNFCVECATDKKEEWHKYFVNIASLVKPGGKLLMAVTKEANYYPVGRENFPVVYLTEQDLREALIKSDFDLEQVYIKEVSADNFDRSYKGFMLISAIKLKK